MTTGIAWLDPILLIIGAGSIVMGAVFGVTRALRPVIHGTTEFLDDWKGEPDRPGVPGRLGVMERLTLLEQGQAAIVHELHPNGGGSMRDAVDRTERQLAEHVQQSQERVDKGAQVEVELRQALADLASAIPTIAESTPPDPSRKDPS